ncbi:glycosyl transferase [Algoriphagus sp. D3-2-R+10]|uniref:glycosyl transferase n=1 Tax=Algoriphagus aurantiacus TaxID=3103948 RepID=UPI002B39126D|nr:glycosyl transferase [Algoriphagus sp. D3-2-R+10]MEB2778316.1 glycosyl transferase [Algoriphagus sp. D3-2-R+10]
MSSLVFTLCSNNYLAHAASLGDSIRQFDPEVEFIIGLVDKADSIIDYSQFSGFDIIPFLELGYPEFQEMLLRYNIIEFNTAVKPFYFEYLFKTRPDLDRIYYIDPDILFYQSIKNIETAWDNASAVLTPNLLYLPEKTVRGELASLKHGINNLGFIGIARSEEGQKIVTWWKERLTHHCKLDKCNGIFVDQKWMDIAALFFKDIKSVKHPGWNMAWWNLTERKLISEEGTYFVNSLNDKLIFFHFSGFRPGVSTMTWRIESAEFDMESDGPLRMLFDAYQDTLYARGFLELSKIKPLIKFREEPNDLRHRIGRKLSSKTRNAIYRIFGVK